MREKKREQAKQPASPLEATGKCTRHGPEPERLKIEGYANWEDAAAVMARARKPPSGWPKR